MSFNVTDFFAGVVAAIAVAGIVILGIAERPVPAELAALTGLAAGWLFRGRAQAVADNKAAQE